MDIPKLSPELQIHMLQLEIRMLKALFLHFDVCTGDVLQRQTDKILKQTLKITLEDPSREPLTELAIRELILRNGSWY